MSPEKLVKRFAMIRGLTYVEPQLAGCMWWGPFHNDPNCRWPVAVFKSPSNWRLNVGVLYHDGQDFWHRGDSGLRRVTREHVEGLLPRTEPVLLKAS